MQQKVEKRQKLITMQVHQLLNYMKRRTERSTSYKIVMPSSYLLLGLLFLYCLVIQTAQAQIPAQPVEVCSYPSTIIPFKGKAYFCADNPDVGRELHVSDGRRFGTKAVIDLDPGPGSSTPRSIFVLNGKLFFFAETTETGLALWETDGTEDGTRLIFTNGNPSSNNGHGNSDTILLSVGSSIAYFVFDGLVYVTDGTRSGTVNSSVAYFRSRDVQPSFILVNNDLLYMNFHTLFRISPDGQVTTVYEFDESEEYKPSIISETSKISGRAIIGRGFFGAQGKTETWLSDGTKNGTRFFRDGSIFPIGNIGENLVFSQRPDSSNYSISNVYSTNGAVTELLLEGGDFYGNQLSEELIGIYLRPSVRNPGSAPWITDGTKSGTQQLAIGASSVSTMTLINDMLIGSDTIIGQRPSSLRSFVWSSALNGSGYKRVTERFDSLFFGGANSNGVLFSTSEDGKRDTVLQFTDGTRAGTKILTSIPSVITQSDFDKEGDRFFIYSVGQTCPALWHSDGTRRGTYPLLFKIPRVEDSRCGFNFFNSPRPGFIPVIDLLMDQEEES